MVFGPIGGNPGIHGINRCIIHLLKLGSRFGRDRIPLTALQDGLGFGKMTDRIAIIIQGTDLPIEFARFLPEAA